MADVIVKQTTVANTTTTSGQTMDITIPGAFGGANPKAAIILANNTTGYTSFTDDFSMSIGFTDGVSQCCIHSFSEDIVATTNVNRSAKSDAVLYITDSGIKVRMLFNQWLPDGIRLSTNWDATLTGSLITVILIGGDDVSATVGTRTMASATETITTGNQTDLVFMSTICDYASYPQDRNAQGRISFGAAINDPGETQKMAGVSSTDNVATPNTFQFVASDYAAAHPQSTANFVEHVNNFTATSFDITQTPAPAGSVTPTMSYLALSIVGNPDISLFNIAIPTTGDYVETQPGFQPEYGMLVMAPRTATLDAHENTDSASLAISTFDPSDIKTLTALDRTGAGTFANSYTTQNFRPLNSDGSSAAVADVYIFTSSGWDFTLTTNPNVPLLGWGLAIGPGATGVTFDGPDIVAQSGTENQAFSFNENGEGTVASRFTGATTYALSPDSDALPTGLTVNATTGNIEGTPTEVATRNIIIRGSE